MVTPRQSCRIPEAPWGPLPSPQQPRQGPWGSPAPFRPRMLLAHEVSERGREWPRIHIFATQAASTLGSGKEI